MGDAIFFIQYWTSGSKISYQASDPCEPTSTVTLLKTSYDCDHNWTRNRFFLYFSIKIDIFKTFHLCCAAAVCVCVSYVASGQDICVRSPPVPGLCHPGQVTAVAPWPQTQHCINSTNISPGIMIVS